MADDNQDGNDDKGRASIWSVRSQDRLQFAGIFFGLFLIGLGLVSYYEIRVRCDDTWIETAIALIRGIGAVGLASVILALLRFDGEDAIMGIARDLWNKHQYQKGITERDTAWGQWLSANPEVQKLIDEQKVEAPPKLNGKNNQQ